MEHTESRFTELVGENRGIVFKVIRLYVNDAEDEKDLYQEILFQAWRSFPNFRGDSKFSTWLYKVSLNTVFTFKRRPRLVVPYEDLSTLKFASQDERTAEIDALYYAIRSLTEVDRVIVTLHLDGYDNEEIAEIAGLTKNHVGVKLFRVKEILGKKLNAQ